MEYIVDRLERGFGIIESQLTDVIQWMIEGETDCSTHGLDIDLLYCD